MIIKSEEEEITRINDPIKGNLISTTFRVKCLKIPSEFSTSGIAYILIKLNKEKLLFRRISTLFVSVINYGLFNKHIIDTK